MMSLFSSFDLFFFNKFFVVLGVILCFLFNQTWKLDSLSSSISNLSPLKSFFFSLKPKAHNKGSMSLTMSIMVFLMLVNFSSVFSYSFPLASSFSTVLSLALTFWLSLILFSLFKSSKNLASHLIPEGSPLGLSIFLFLIELISMVIRPLTLTVRLTANILAGHLLMILLSKLVLMLPVVSILYLVLNLVELFVSLIQAYIFCTMLTLYFSEVH